MVIDRAHNHGHGGGVATHIGQHLQGAGGVQVSHHHGAGACQACGHQRLQAHRIAKHHRITGGGGLAHAVRVKVKRHVLDALLLQHVAQVLAAAAIATNDDVLAGVDGLAGNAGHLQRLLQPFTGHQLHHDVVAVQNNKRRGQHGQHHAGQNRVEQIGRHQPVFSAQGQQHKTKLTGLGQVQAGAQGHAGGGAQCLRQPGDQQQLEKHRQGGQHQHEGPALQHDMPVQQHADADEKQAQQHIMEGPDVGLHLMLELGFRNQHARNKSAESQAQARQLGQPGQSQRNQQQVQDKQLFAFASGHNRQPPAHHALAASHQQPHQHSGFQPCHRQRCQQLVGR